MKTIKILSLAILGIMLSLHIASAAAQPIPGVDIIAKKNPGGGKGPQVLITTTDETGTFTIHGLEQGTYDVYINSQEHKAVGTATVGTEGTLSGQLSLSLKTSERKVLTKANLDAEAVVRIKAILKKEGVLGNMGELSKDMAGLRADIIKFQKKHKMKADGIVGTGTLKELNKIEASSTVEASLDAPQPYKFPVE